MVARLHVPIVGVMVAVGQQSQRRTPLIESVQVPPAIQVAVIENLVPHTQFVTIVAVQLPPTTVTLIHVGTGPHEIQTLTSVHIEPPLGVAVPFTVILVWVRFIGTAR